jgi:hypothetical protein
MFPHHLDVSEKQLVIPSVAIHRDEHGHRNELQGREGFDSRVPIVLENLRSFKDELVESSEDCGKMSLGGIIQCPWVIEHPPDRCDSSLHTGLPVGVRRMLHFQDLGEAL